jgi:hypothetical protein
MCGLILIHSLTVNLPIQLTGNDDLKTSDRSHLWAQIEAKVRLNRHKAVMRSCQARAAASLSLKTPNDSKEERPTNDSFREFGSSLPEIRQVLIEKEGKEPLGISITGGKEHGIPILVSEIRRHTPAARCARLYVGDAILKVNGIELSHHSHEEAASILMQQSGNCLLECVFLPAEPDQPNESNGEGDYELGFRNYFDLDMTDSIGNPIHDSQSDLLHSSSTDLNVTADDDRMSSVTESNSASKLYPGSAEPLLERLRL